jgi:hypothetical protein
MGATSNKMSRKVSALYMFNNDYQSSNIIDSS